MGDIDERTANSKKSVLCLAYRKTPAAQNMCSTGFDHGFRKQEMVEEYASGKYAKEYGTGYQAGRELSFKQTGSRRKSKRRLGKSRRTRKHK